MKKTTAVLFLFLLLFALCACGAGSKSTDVSMFFRTADTSAADPQLNYPLETQYIRTNGGWDGEEYPMIAVLRSRGELDAYYEKNKNLYDLERKDAAFADTTIGFLDACDQYDETFFAEYDLILVLVGEGSGSIGHEIQSIRPAGESDWLLSGIRIVPEVCTDDTAEWHFLVAIGKGTIEPDDTVTLELADYQIKE